MSMGAAAAELAEAVPTVQAFTATFLGVEGELAQLLAPDGVVLAAKATADWPQAGMTVWCVVLGSQRLMLGPPGGPASNLGRVLSVGTDRATVERPPGSGISASYRTPRGVAPAVGDTVLLSPEEGGLILAAYAPEVTTGPVPPPETAPTPTTRTENRVAEVLAAWDGTAQPNGWWLRGSSLYTRHSSGGNNFATIGYSGRVQQVIPDPARVTSGEVYMVLQRTGSQHTVGTHTLGGPSGVPTPANTSAVTPTSGWVRISLEAARALASGAAQGLTFYGGAGTVYAGMALNPAHGRLRLHYDVEV